jgi:hypothetical protein
MILAFSNNGKANEEMKINVEHDSVLASNQETIVS